MRLPIATGLFALAVLAAACGGGGGGSASLVPGGPNVGTTPSSAITTRANMVFLIPPPSKQSSSRKPFYISSSTQSFGILAVAATSTETPAPGVNMQIFPVTTPSPCSLAAGGGETCTFSIVAPVGNDIFYIGAFAAANPGINSVPLSEFQTGTVAVSLNPSPGASPLAFALNSVVDEVVVTVPSPDPHNTPNTEVFAEGTVSSATQLGITAYDSANNIIAQDPTIVFATPIPITVTPGNSGIGVSIVGSQCGNGGAALRPRRNTAFSNGAATVSVLCAADLNNVYFGYDGTLHVDSSDHLIANASINAGAEHVTPTPTPANVALASNVLTHQLSTDGSAYGVGLQSLAGSGQLVYMLDDYDSTGMIGTFTPSTQTLSAALPLNVNGQDDVSPNGFIATPGGPVWVIDNYNFPASLDCFSSTAGGTSPISPVTFTSNGGDDQLYIESITVDGSGNVWYIGVDENSESESYFQTYAGYFPAGSSCTTPGTTNAQFYLNGDYDDANSGPFLAPLGTGNGIAYASAAAAGGVGLYVITTSSSSTLDATTPAVGGGIGGGTAVDNSGTVYSVFNRESEGEPSGAPDLEKFSSNALSHALGLPPASGNPSYGSVYGLAAFSPSGAADRFAYADSEYAALGVVENFQTTPIPMLISMPNAAYVSQAAYSSTGGEYMLFDDANGNTWLGESLLTPTWSAPVTSYAQTCSGSVVYSILERGDSGPFNVTFTPTNGSSAVTSTPWPDADHNVPFNAGGSGGTYNVTVTDKNGRSQTNAVTEGPYAECG